MALLRPALRTGIFVLLTLGLLLLVLLLLGAPGLLHSMKTFRIYFDNAGGIREGADVSIAGRKVGQVVRLYSPIDPAARPKTQNGEKLEVLIEVNVARESRIYKQVDVSMYQYSLLGEPVIDFARGDPSSGLAPDGYVFIGKRTPDATEATRNALEKIDPVLARVNETLDQLRATGENLKEMTEPGSDARLAIGSYREVGQRVLEMLQSGGAIHDTFENLRNVTSPKGAFGISMGNLERISTDLAENKRIQLTLQQYENAARDMQRAGRSMESTVKTVRPELLKTAVNARNFTDTIKRQPWRLFWPSTKKYPEDEVIEPKKMLPVSKALKK